MTYARMRLFLGISCVGTLVVVSSYLLLSEKVPLLVSASRVGLPSFAGDLALFLLFGFLLLFPFEMVGGYFMPRSFGRSSDTLSSYLKKWGRGAVIHFVVLLGIALLLHLVAISFSPTAAVILLPVVFLALISAQGFLFQLISSSSESNKQHSVHRPPVVIVADSGESFTGGIVGLPGFERVVLPKIWEEKLGKEEFSRVLERRAAAVSTGARTRGVMYGVIWNFLGVLLSLIPNQSSLLTPAGMVTASLWFTLFSFVGLLVLPWFSRQGVYFLDGLGARDDEGQLQTLLSAIEKTEALGDDEPVRSDRLESVFHPIPSVQNRESALYGELPRYHFPPGWNIARTVLFLSWGFLGLLSRAVHCNCGRPHLWVLLPAD